MAAVGATQVDIIASKEPHIVGDERAYWQLTFCIKTPAMLATFISEEPYMKKCSEWAALAHGDTHIHLYDGNGHGFISREDDLVTFSAAPSGSGGDVVSTFVVPWAVLAPQYLKTLQSAQARGLPFKPE